MLLPETPIPWHRKEKERRNEYQLEEETLSPAPALEPEQFGKKKGT